MSGKNAPEVGEIGTEGLSTSCLAFRGDHIDLDQQRVTRMTPEQRERLIEILRAGETPDSEWHRVLFPPAKREYELVYDGKESAEEILAGTIGVPLQPVRTFGRNGKDWHNMLIFGDNLQVMKTLLKMKEDGLLVNADGSEGIKAIYIDPPFATRQEFQGTQEEKAYRDKLAGARFIEFLRKRLVFMRELLSDSGSVYIHMDWRKAHYFKVVLDEIFGEHRFRNEIIWFYRRWSAGSQQFQRQHETLLYYSKNSLPTFNVLYEPYTEGTLRRWKGIKRKTTVGEDGKLFQQEDTEGIQGANMGDVWPISIINANAAERTGYPTQKPERLIERVIRASTNQGDLVADFFCGSGTTLAVADKLSRRWIGIDCGKLAIYTVQKRMLNLRSEPGNNKGKRLIPKPFTLYNAGLYDFSKLRDLPWKDWRFFALQLFQCKDEPHRIGGIKLDGYLKSADVLVFNHFDSVGAKVTYETIDDIHEALGKKVGRYFFIIAPALSFAFQEDYVDRNGTRYYALRIPYSIINELHRRDFTAIRQPVDESEINDTVESVGFDFIRTPIAKVNYRMLKPKGDVHGILRIKVATFQSEVISRSATPLDNLESLSMLMVDVDYNGEVFDLDYFMLADELKENEYQFDIPVDKIRKRLMVVLLDIYGNEFREVKTADEINVKPSKNNDLQRNAQ